MALEPGSRLGAYEITALIGVGGMGEVYRARDTVLRRDVALKTLPDAGRLNQVGAERQRKNRFVRSNVGQLDAKQSEERVVADQPVLQLGAPRRHFVEERPIGGAGARPRTRGIALPCNLRHRSRVRGGCAPARRMIFCFVR